MERNEFNCFKKLIRRHAFSSDFQKLPSYVIERVKSNRYDSVPAPKEFQDILQSRSNMIGVYKIIMNKQCFK